MEEKGTLFGALVCQLFEKRPAVWPNSQWVDNIELDKIWNSRKNEWKGPQIRSNEGE